MAYKEIFELFMEINREIVKYNTTLVDGSFAEERNKLRRTYNTYVEKILEELSKENYEMIEILRPYLKLDLQGIMSTFKELNIKYRRSLGHTHIEENVEKRNGEYMSLYYLLGEIFLYKLDKKISINKWDTKK